MSRGVIVIVPGGGLCNRMVMLDSAMALGRELDRPVHVLWKLGSALNCRVDRLFAPLPGVERVRYVPNDTLYGRLSVKLRQKLADWRGFDTLYRHELTVVGRDPVGMLERARRSPRLRVRGDGRFYRAARDFQGFAPAPALAARIAALEPHLRDAVGVHVRRTDNVDAIRRSPLTAFAEAMRAQRRQDPSVRFFLATDDPRVVAELRGEFGDAILHHPPRSLDRGDPRAIEDALVELWCLASCRYLLGSAASSFSQTAWELRGIPHEQIDVTGP